MKKILLIDDNYHKPGNGAPLFEMERRSLETAGYKVYTLAFTSEKVTKDHEKEFTVNESPHYLISRASKFLGSSQLSEKIKQIILKIKPDLIHNHLIAKYPSAVFEAIPSFIPLIQTLHGTNFFCPTSWGNIINTSEKCTLGISKRCVKKGCLSIPKYFLFKKLFNNTDLNKVNVFHCPSKYIENIANNLGLNNTCHIELGLRKEFSKMETKNIVIQNKLLFIGSLAPQKGLDYLLEAIKLLQKSIPSIKLYIAGKGAYLEHYKNMTTDLKINENVVFLGFVPKEKVTSLFRSVDLTIVPSVWEEQFGMIGPESMACGTPVIASNVGGIPEWLHDNENGYLVNPRDSNDLYNKIYDLLNDVSKIKKMSKTGQRSVIKFNQERYNLEILNLIKKYEK